MKKILIRSGMSPFDNFDPCYIINHDSIGTNVGNLVYANSIYRTFMIDDDTVIDSNYYRANAGMIDDINKNYDCFILPFADGFREDFVRELRDLTGIIKKIKIPCVVIGVGLKAPFEPDFNNPFPFDEDVKEFMKTVLDKSAIVGVRGEITSQYLTNLGFKEGIDHTVIGCPSMYTFGRNLEIKDLIINENSRICFNASVLSPLHVHEFLDRSMKKFKDHYYIPQQLKELRLLYTGAPYKFKNDIPCYPQNINDEIYKNDRVRFFLNVPTWVDFLKNSDLCIGSRLHGNIVAAIAGTPSIIIPHDARMREITEYHHLTHVLPGEINENTDLYDLVNNLNFKEVTKYQNSNFDNFISFLNRNGLEHIYKNTNNPEYVPFDKKMSEIDLHGYVKSINKCTKAEIIDRFDEYLGEYNLIYDEKVNELRKLKVKNQDLKNALNQQEKSLGLRSLLNKLKQFSPVRNL